MFLTELDFFIKSQDELVKQYDGKVLIIKGNKIIGVYSTCLEAYTETLKSQELGTFMIQPCFTGVDAYTTRISSSDFFSDWFLE